MRKAISIPFAILVFLILSSCSSLPNETSDLNTKDEIITTETDGATVNTIETMIPSESADESETTIISTSYVLPSETTNTITEITNSITETSISGEPDMYSSYAHLVSYDPARGSAEFDYFNILKGDEAVQWLVNNDGYSLAEAESLVNNFADSEFIEQNQNLQLRTIDLQNIELKLMYYPDGSMVPDAIPIDSELIDLYNLYHIDADLVLNSFFYYIEVLDGTVNSVEQVFWP